MNHKINISKLINYNIGVDYMINDPMCLNNKIKDYMKKNKKRNVERLDSIGIKLMLEELETTELSLITFSALADIYAMPYKFTLTINHKGKIIEEVINSDDDKILWFEIDKLYKRFIGEIPYSATMTLRELEEAFEKVNGKVLFE